MKYSLSIPQQSSFPQLTTFSSGFAKSDIQKIINQIAHQWFVKQICSRSKVVSELTIAKGRFWDPFSFSIILLSVTAVVALSALWKVIICFSKMIVLKVFANRETNNKPGQGVGPGAEEVGTSGSGITGTSLLHLQWTWMITIIFHITIIIIMITIFTSLTCQCCRSRHLQRSPRARECRQRRCWCICSQSPDWERGCC